VTQTAARRIKTIPHNPIIVGPTAAAFALLVYMFSSRIHRPDQALLGVVLDYSVLDHLGRIQDGSYAGQHTAALSRLRHAAELASVVVWMAEITPVEMIHGIEKVHNQPAKHQTASERDARKVAVARAMNACRLGYPCSKIGDTYSRIGLSFRLAGEKTHLANALEKRLGAVKDVSAGDARQLVCCAFAFDGSDTSFHPRLDWFVSEDERLVRAVRTEQGAGRLPELLQLRIGSASELASACSPPL
jgi:hypothetical protein